MAGFVARTSSASSTFPTAAAAAPPSSVVFTPRAFTPPSSAVLVVGRVDAAPADGCKKLTLDWRGVVVVVMVVVASRCRGVVAVAVVVVVVTYCRGVKTLEGRTGNDDVDGAAAAAVEEEPRSHLPW